MAKRRSADLQHFPELGISLSVAEFEKRFGPEKCHAALQFLAGLTAARRRNPERLAVALPDGPKPIPVTANPDMKHIFKVLKAAQRGKPVDHEIDFLDGSPPLIVQLPLPKPRESTRRSYRPPGAPRKVTAEQVQAMRNRYPGAILEDLAKILVEIYGLKSLSVSTVKRRLAEKS